MNDMSTIPERVTARWIATLADGQLVDVESRLHTEFLAEEKQEKLRRGTLYAMLRGPATLLDAWHRWARVNNETRSRGLLVRHAK
jgi:hypothetical protein